MGEESINLFCPKCKKQIPNMSVFCLFCGAGIDKKKKKPASRRPNNSGTIRKLSGKREKPYAAYLPSSMGGGFVGTYKSKSDAANSLMIEITARPSSNRSEWTVEDFYNFYINSSSFNKLSEDMKGNIRAAWKYCDKIKNYKMKNVKAQEWQSCIDHAVSLGRSQSTSKKIKNLSSHLCQEAMKDDVINKNYSKLISIDGTPKKEKDIFTVKELELIKSHDADIEAKFILILVYTGFRISELLETDVTNVSDCYIISGKKTNAGKNRIVPILPEIIPYINYFKRSEGYLIHRDGQKVTANYARKYWFYKYLVKLGILSPDEFSDPEKSPRITPHKTRGLFATMAYQSGVDIDVITRVIGHSDFKITSEVYITTQAEFLRNELLKISNLDTNGLHA